MKSYESDEQLSPSEKRKLKSLIVTVIVALCLIVTCCNSCTVVQQRERGVEYVFGQLKGEVIQPGLKMHPPFISTIKKYSIVPKEYQVTFPVGPQGAISKDLQTIGATVNIKYAFDESRIKEIALKYGDSIIEAAMETKTQSSVKAVVGTYTIYDLVEKQTEVARKIAENIVNEMTMYPIIISTIDVTNWDWSDDFDKQIKETALRTQQVKTAAQEAEIAAAQAQKKVKEAEADKQAAILQAEAEVAKAQGESDAKKIRADADAYEAQKIAQNQQAYQKQWDYEIALEKAKRWNGKEVPDAAYIVPGTGAVVPLTVK